jgi:aminomethyltransferase
VDAGREFDARPIGLGARDTLRLEMAYSLYGHELSAEISVLEANLDWTVRFGPDFLGKEALVKQRDAGVERTIAGIVVQEKRGAPRHSAPVYSRAGQQIGVVTSGSFSPSLEIGIGLVLIPPKYAGIGEQVLVDIRGTRVAAKVVELPFYSPRKR